jgi:hypothetical protein
VTDLIAKEILVACLELEGHVPDSTQARWRKALSGFDPASCFTGPAKIAAGRRLTNYEIYAGVAEWLRNRESLTIDRAYLEQFLALSLPLFTANGMYRDPGDPALYDLSVRQNLAELLHYGYDGPHRHVLDELLRRAGLCTLLTVSPNGYAPFGGRSNWFVHNEAMVAYVCEFEALRYARRGSTSLAALFRGTARRATESIRPFLEDFQPPHNLKNAFDPASKHGRDTGYGEYGVYSLLAASLLARTALIADSDIPASKHMLGEHGAFLVLHPAFHRLFASCGNTLVQVDLDAQEHYDATGIGRFHVQGVPTALGLSAPIAADPKYIVGDHRSPSGLAYAPCWRRDGGDWISLAGQTGQVDTVQWKCRSASRERVAWQTVHTIAGTPGVTVRQNCDLQPGILTVTATVDAPGHTVGFDVPLLHSDGAAEATVEIQGTRASVTHKGGLLTVQAPETANLSLDSTLQANREALYRRLRITTQTNRISVTVRLSSAGKH